MYTISIKKFMIFAVSLPLVGCNIYGKLDKPKGDPQLLSAARACFDQGDFECAGNYYSQLSSSSLDQANTEGAFEILASNGASVGTFMKAIIKYPEDPGKLITYLSNSLTNTAGQSLRLDLFHAFQKYKTISTSGGQGLVAFITSLTLLSELLAEASIVRGNLQQSDLASNPSQCLAAPLTGCDAPAGSALQLAGTALDLRTATDASLSGAPTLQMIDAAIAQIAGGIQLMAAQGNLATSTIDFATELNTAAAIALGSPTSQGQAYRFLLLNLNLGTD